MAAWVVPSIAGIQRLNLVIAAVVAAVLAWWVSFPSGAACLFGAAVVIANLFVLSLLGGPLIAAAGAHPSRGITRLGMLVVPLKMALLVGLVYLVFANVKVDALGFGFGVLTQLAAIIIETWRASRRAVA